jgi:hypothetical protein
MNPKPKGKNRKQSQTNYQNPCLQTKYMYMRKHIIETISPNLMLRLSTGPGGAAASRAADDDVSTRICDGAIWGED